MLRTDKQLCSPATLASQTGILHPAAKSRLPPARAVQQVLQRCWCCCAYGCCWQALLNCMHAARTTNPLQSNHPNPQPCHGGQPTSACLCKAAHENAEAFSLSRLGRRKATLWRALQPWARHMVSRACQPHCRTQGRTPHPGNPAALQAHQQPPQLLCLKRDKHTLQLACTTQQRP